MRRRRIIRTTLLILIVGAMINVAIAWGFALLPGASDYGRGPTDGANYQYEDGRYLSCMAMQKLGARYWAVSCPRARYQPTGAHDDVPEFLQRQQSFARRSILNWLGNINAPNPPNDYIAVIARGWPMCSLYSIEEHDIRRDIPGTRAEFADRGAIVIPLLKRKSTGFAPSYAIALPYWPTWPGFAINTILFAAILFAGWLMIVGPGIVRRTFRLRRGLCPPCGYPIGTSEVCTECGAALPSEQERNKRTNPIVRAVTLVIAFLVAGIVLNIAVAWACAGLVILPKKPDLKYGWEPVTGIAGVAGWDVTYGSTAWGARILAVGRPTLRPGLSADVRPQYPVHDWRRQLDVIGATPKESSNALLIFDARGWPSYALDSCWDVSASRGLHDQRWRWGISITAQPYTGMIFDLKALPTRPLWPGFAINTLFYAATLWLLFFTLSKMCRRRSRNSSTNDRNPTPNP